MGPAGLIDGLGEQAGGGSDQALRLTAGHDSIV